MIKRMEENTNNLDLDRGAEDPPPIKRGNGNVKEETKEAELKSSKNKQRPAPK